jgi:HTH-type transcriptional regulator / antitoxin HigA
MEIKPIRSEADYDEALREIEALFDSPPDTPEADRLDVLVALVEAYEAHHHAIPAPDPIEAIEHEMERQALAPRDLAPPRSRGRAYRPVARTAGLVLRETPDP